jgi:hypothetical protein
MSRCLLLAIFLTLAGPAAGAETPHTQNPDQPRDGVQVLQLQERWHRGHEQDDLFFGAIRKVLAGPDGNIYLLDQQLSQVAVFSPGGEFLHYLSREGEGPGECRRPEDMVFLPDGTLGLAQYINGKIIRVGLDNIPHDTIMPPGYDPQQGGAMSSIRRVRCRGDVLVVNGARVQPDGQDGMSRTQYLVSCDDQGRPLVEYLSSTVPSNIMRDGWSEKRNWFPSHDRWDLDGQGNLLACVQRNDYRVTVYGPEGLPLRTFGRDFDPRRRTAEQKQEIRDSVTVLRDGQRIEIEVHVEDSDPALVSVHCRPDGEIWVLPATGRHDQEPGIMQTYDVFSPTGEFVRQVAVACPGDPEEDSLFLLGPGQAVLVRGAVQARRNTFGGSRGEEKEVPVHDVLYYTF